MPGGRPSSYTEEQIRRGLLTVAKHGGSGQRASRELRSQGINIPARTLNAWRQETHTELYRELHKTHATDIEASLVAEFREVAIAASRGTLEAVNIAVTKLPESKDPAAAARNLATTAAISMDKLYLATDRPTEVRQDRGANEILNALANRLGLTSGSENTSSAPETPQQHAVDTTADDITEGQFLPVPAV